MLVTAVAALGLALTLPLGSARAQLGVPGLPSVPSVPGVTELPGVPELPAVPADLPLVPDLLGGGSDGGSGGSQPEPSPAPTLSSPAGEPVPTPASEPVARTPADVTDTSRGAPAAGPARHGIRARPSRAPAGARGGSTAPAASSAKPAGSEPGGERATEAVGTADARDSRDIVERIVEVIPGWAKALIGALAALVLALAAAAHQRLRRRAAVNRHQALHDPLTGLPNRTLFRDRVARAALLAEREGRQIAVMLIDLDGFKEVNDTLGHGNGDRLLQQIGSRLREAVRASDTVARLGGDEFAVLLPAVSGEDAAATVAEELRRTLEGPFLLADLSIHPDASVGIAMYPRHGEDADTLIQHADVAMYLAKEARAGVVVYDADRDRYSPDRLALVGELRRAIEHGELTLYYQPQVEPETGRVGGVEALLRWQHPERGLVPPDQFIPLAERTGLIRPLTMWVLEAALRQCASWRRAGLDLWVAANLSAANLLDADTPDEIERLLRRWNVPPGLFRLEITETTAMADPVRTRAVLSRLDAMGVQLAIDDFGTGYSSLAYLKRLPVHELKIDRSFVSNMVTDPNDEVIVTSTIDLGHNLGLRVVAEGVEDQETLNELIRRGCDLAQGYLFTRPLPAAEFRSWLTEWQGAEMPNDPVLRHAALLSASR